METGRTDEAIRDDVRCADVLGSFGVTPADVRAQRREYRTAVPPGRDGAEEPLETLLSDVLADERDRTTMVRETICRSDRGLSCSARYAQTALARELEGVFASVGWSFDCERTGPAPNGRNRLELTATDSKGRSRTTTVTYPSTPLADDNLPAVLFAIDERLLAGTDATLVLLSTGVDRWRAALVEERELETLRGRYGPRISAFERPLLPKHGLEAYVPEDGAAESVGLESVDPDEPGPWPLWALERADRRRSSGFDPANGGASGGGALGSLIDEAEPDSADETGRPTGTRAADERERTDGASLSAGPGSTASSESAESARSTASEAWTTADGSAESREIDGFELRGAPTVARVRDEPRNVASESDSDPNADASGSTRNAGATRLALKERDGRRPRDGDASETAEFGTLSGPRQTTRVGNDAFGTGDEFETQTDRYRAFGAALGAGGAVSVDGLLEDDEFIPELPAVEPAETRIEFAETFDPDAVSTAKAAGERGGFEWVDAGSLETTRVSDP